MGRSLEVPSAPALRWQRQAARPQPFARHDDAHAVPLRSGPRVLLVDDEIDVVEALESGLRNHCRVHATSRAAEAMQWIEDQPPFDAVVSDSEMPHVTGPELLVAVRERDEATARILLTGSPNVTALGEAVNRARVHRFLLKPYPVADLASAIREVIHEAAPHKARATVWRQYGVSPRECEVLERLVHGERARQAAEALYVSEHTVRGHIKALLRKFGVRSQADLVLAARRAEARD
ncbi:MAG: response regulator transcription factor [Myxococcales bacterium FL481]|nr:MAG: response regulator transcription factor [Myxococcales bacterium FL481]